MSTEIKYAALGPKDVLGQEHSALKDIRNNVRTIAMRIIGSLNKELKSKLATPDAIITVDGEHGDKHAIASQRTVTVEWFDNVPHEVFYEIITAFLDAGWDTVRIVQPSESSRMNVLHVLLFTTMEGKRPLESGMVTHTGLTSSIRGFQHLPKIPQENNDGIESSEVWSGNNKPIDVLSVRG